MLSLFYNENYEMQREMHYIKWHLKAGYELTLKVATFSNLAQQATSHQSEAATWLKLWPQVNLSRS